MCAYYGVTGWFFEVDDFATEEQRLYSVSPAAVKVLQTNFAFQTWDFAVSFLHKELNAPEMLAHHSLAALLCYWGLTMPYMHYYAIYFMGVAEVSSVPLVLVDICKYYPEFAKRFPLVDLLSKLAFAAAFVAVRDVFWVYTAVTVWKDGVGILRRGTSRRSTRGTSPRPCSSPTRSSRRCRSSGPEAPPGRRRALRREGRGEEEEEEVTTRTRYTHTHSRALLYDTSVGRMTYDAIRTRARRVARESTNFSTNF